MSRLSLNILHFSTRLLDLKIAWILFPIMIAIGAVGFMFLEGYDFVDALYMSVITVSTVGFGEVKPMGEAGRLFVSVFVIINTAVFAYVLAAFSYFVIEGNLFNRIYQKRMQKAIDKMDGHIVLCGCGKYGSEIIDHLIRHQNQLVVIDQDEERLKAQQDKGGNILYVIGDATNDDVLEAAGIERAASLISALGDDSDNLFIVLSANQLNPQLRIISRAMTIRSRTKILKAGATHVIMPEQIGGFYMASLISKPGAVEFFSFITNELSSDIGFEEIRYEILKEVFQDRPIRDLDLRHKTGVNIIAYRDKNGSYLVNPSPEIAITKGGSFIVLGSEQQLAALHKYLDKQ